MASDPVPALRQPTFPAHARRRFVAEAACDPLVAVIQ